MLGKHIFLTFHAIKQRKDKNGFVIATAYSYISYYNLL